MRGCNKSLSAPRRLITDLMRASRSVPLITFRRQLDLAPLARARAACADPPGFAAIFVKAFGLVAKEQPMLRTLYIGFPRAHLFELPCSIAMVAVARQVDGEDCVLMEKICSAEHRPLAEVDAMIRHAATAPPLETTERPQTPRSIRSPGHLSSDHRW